MMIKKIELKEEIRNAMGTDKFYRMFEIENIDKENRTVELSFSSEEPYERWWGTEILSHEKGSIDFSRLENSAPLLAEHNRDAQIGVVETAWVEEGKGRSRVRFSKNSEKGIEYFADVEDGIRKNVSVGYQILEMSLTSEKDGEETYTVNKWLPFEISMVSIPADQSVGVGRSAEVLEKKEIAEIAEEKIIEKEVKKMDEKELAGIRVTAQKEERSRVEEISAIAAHHKMGDLAKAAIGNGASVDEFRSLVLDQLGTREQSINSNAADIGMSKKEAESFSFSRALQAALTGDWSKAGFELEASKAVEKISGNTSRGFYVPHEVLKRDLTTVNTSNIVDTQYMGGSFIDILRNKMILSRLGGTVLTGLSGNIAIPKQTGTGTTYWITEGEDTTQSDLTVGMINMTPKTVTGATAFTRQMLLQGNPSIENLALQDLAANIALAIDYAGINGSGVNDPLGLLNMTGLSAVDCSTTNGGLDWKNAVAFETAIATQNADINNMNYVAGAGVTGTLKTTLKASNGSAYLLEGNQVNGYNYNRTNQVPADTMLFGDFSQMVTGLWGGLDIMIDPYAKAASGGTVLRAFQSCDVATRHIESFTASKNINQ